MFRNPSQKALPFALAGLMVLANACGSKQKTSESEGAFERPLITEAAYQERLNELAVIGSYNDTELFLSGERLVDINKPSVEGLINVLHLAVYKNNKEVVKALLKMGADVNRGEEKTLTTPLMIAVRLGHREIVEILLKDPKIKIEQKDSLGQTALMKAIQYQENDLALELTKREARAFASDRFDDTGIHLLLSQRLDKEGKIQNSELLNALLEAPQNATEANYLLKQNVLKRTALHEGVVAKSVNSLELLINKYPWKSTSEGNKEVVVKDLNGRTPLSYAVEAGLGDEARKLLDLGSQMKDAVGPKGLSALHVVAGLGHTHMLPVLGDGLDLGTLVKQKDAEGKTPFTYALLKEEIEMAQALLPYGPELMENDKDGKNLLSQLILLGKNDASEYLAGLLSKVQLDTQDSKGMTSLMHAAAYGSLDLVKSLITNHKADYLLKNKDGKDVFEIAKENKDVAIQSYLITLDGLQDRTVEHPDTDGGFPGKGIYSIFRRPR